MLEGRSEYIKEIEKGVEWLLTQQLDDGGWRSSHMLRIPHPSIEEPWRQSLWKRDGKAINSIIKDHKRLYSTATVFTALSRFKEHL
jgi:hypothetical protein